LKESDKVSEVAPTHGPDESDESALTLPKSSETRGGKNQAFGRIEIHRSAFCVGQNFYSIVIIAPLHISKSSRVLKNLTTEWQRGVF
jgi:hypothetical protein